MYLHNNNIHNGIRIYIFILHTLIYAICMILINYQCILIYVYTIAVKIFLCLWYVYIISI